MTIFRGRAWILGHEREKWAMRLSFLLSPRKMIQMWREWNQERDKAIVAELKKKTWKGWGYLYLLIWMCLVFLSAYAINRPAKYPIETHHNVYVWSQVKGARATWWISSDEPEPNKLPLMRWNCCPDFPCSTVMDSMIIASTAKWEERGTCKSIRASGLGWTWEKEIPNASAASSR